MSVTRAADLTHNMYQLNVVLPDSHEHKSILLNMDDEQAKLYQIIQKIFRVLQCGKQEKIEPND